MSRRDAITIRVYTNGDGYISLEVDSHAGSHEYIKRKYISDPGMIIGLKITQAWIDDLPDIWEIGDNVKTTEA